MMICFLPESLMSLAKSSLSMALIWPGRRTIGASGSRSAISFTIGPFGPVSKEVVMMEGILKKSASLTRPRTLLRNSSGVKSRTRVISPD